MAPEPCGVENCPAFAHGDDGFCVAHAGAKRVGHVMSGTKCSTCERPIDVGDWITRESTVEHMTHMRCQPKRPAFGRKVDRAKPLLEGI